MSNTQSLHNELAELTAAHPGFKISNDILALLLVIKIPCDSFNSIIQQLLSDLKNLTTRTVCDWLLTESQSMNPTNNETSVALTVQQKSKKSQKGDCSSKEPNNMCHLPSHAFSMHSNAKCRTQNPSLQPSRANQNPRIMGRSNPARITSTSQGLVAISMLTDAEKALLLDHPQSSHANSVTSNNSANDTEPSSTATPRKNDDGVYFANAYSAIAQSSVKSNGMISDSGANYFIFHSLERFINLRPLNPVSIKTADGSCHMTSIYAGDVLVKSFDDQHVENQMMLPNTLYCPEISINLISASQLCDAGKTSSGTFHRMKNMNFSLGEQLHATTRIQMIYGLFNQNHHLPAS